MGSHTLEVLRQGLWASVTGGWFFDPHQDIFCNTFHLYLWLFLLCFPFSLYLALAPSPAVWIIYCAVIAFVFTCIKVINFRLHLMFDFGEIIDDKNEGHNEDEAGDKAETENEDVEKGQSVSLNDNTHSNKTIGESIEGIEMQEFGSKRSITPPIGCSSRNSFNEEMARKRAAEMLDNDCCSDEHKVEVHPMEATYSSEDTLVKALNTLDSIERELRLNSYSDETQSRPTSTITDPMRDSSIIPGSVDSMVTIEEGSPPKIVTCTLSSSSINSSGDSLNRNIAMKPKLVRRFGAKPKQHNNDDIEMNVIRDCTPRPMFVSSDDNIVNTKPRCQESKRTKKDLEVVVVDLDKHDSCEEDEDTSSLFNAIITRQTADTSGYKVHNVKYTDPVDMTDSGIKIKKCCSAESPREMGQACDVSTNTGDLSKLPAVENDDIGLESSFRFFRSSAPRNSGFGRRGNIKRSSLGKSDVTGMSSNLGVHFETKSSPSLRRDSNMSSSDSPITSRTTSMCSASELESTLDSSSVFSPNEQTLDETVICKSANVLSAVSQTRLGTLLDTDSENSAVEFDSGSSVGLNWLFEAGDSDSNIVDWMFSTELDSATTTEDSENSGNAMLRNRVSEGAIPKKRARQDSLDSLEMEPSTSTNIFSKFVSRMLGEQTERATEPVVSGRRRRAENTSENESGQDANRNSDREGDRERTSHLRRRLAERRRRRQVPTSSPATVNPEDKEHSKKVHSDLSSSISASLSLGGSTDHGTHVALTHDDTTSGAVHYFQDEHGNWLSYKFSDGSTGIADSMTTCPLDLGSSPLWADLLNERRHSSSEDSNSTVIIESQANHSSRDTDLEQERRALREIYGDLLQYHIEEQENTSNKSDRQQSKDKTVLPKVVYNYKFWVLPCKYIMIGFDRLALMALLDRNRSYAENVVAILLATMVATLGYYLLIKEYFKDFWIFLFCFVIGSCQYSLFKSVQPDAASPMHGHNRITAFSRPLYFCICCSLVLLLDYCASEPHLYQTRFTLYGVPFTSQEILLLFRNVILVLILCFPIIFLIGLLPQCNTFTTYFLEQFDIHLFGGNATSSLSGALYSFCRSILVVSMLFGLAYVALQDSELSSQHVLFSVFCGLLVSLSYHLSRSTSDFTVLWSIVKQHVWPSKETQPATDGTDIVDPLPEKLEKCVSERLQSDIIVCALIAILAFAVHVSTVFTVLQPTLSYILYILAGVVGVVFHYFIPQMRKQLPWLCVAHPVMKNDEYTPFEVSDAAKVMWFEKVHVWICFIERNIIHPLVFMSALTTSSPEISIKFGSFAGAIIVTICGMKALRMSFSDPARVYWILIFTVLFFTFDFRMSSESFLIDYFFMSVLLIKFYEYVLKMQFVITYIAPWQITWGSAFHAFAQPFSVPHSAMLFIQAAISALFSTPLNPFLGSAIFFTSYVRPIKFWERDYNTKRVDHSNTRLASQLDRMPGSDDNNLNSIFYEHLTRSLQHSLYGDLQLGRWGTVSQGDCYILASDYLNALVHIIELANGLVTFQLRGLEFRGTYCQQREVEAITEGIEEDDGCCCCEPGHLPHMLSFNAAFNQRWLAWQVTSSKYVLEGYSISDNSAASMLQVFDLRKILVTYYVKSIIYYVVRSPKLNDWLSTDGNIQESLKACVDKNYADCDPTFTPNIDEDFDHRSSGISRNAFCNTYGEWIQYCANRRQQDIEAERDSALVTLCFALCILGRRALGTASHHLSASLESFLYGLHALFKGDFRITSVRDEWVFNDMELLRRCVAPGIRMALKLHQDHFTSPDEYDDHKILYDSITSHEENMVISHEGDPAWRNAVLSNTPSLLALRHVLDDGTDEYKIIMLNKRYLSFRLIKVNRECVRGLWAGQQQELVFLRNRNPERGSIQNAKQALRNMINSSCDQPIGYPIYVSPLTTSYSETNQQLCGVSGGSISFKGIQDCIIRHWSRLLERCGAGCSSGGISQDTGGDTIPQNVSSTVAITDLHHGFPSHSSSIKTSDDTIRIPTQEIQMQQLGQLTGSMSSATGSMLLTGNKRNSAALLYIAGLYPSQTSEPILQRVKIIDPSQVYDTLNSQKYVQWPNEHMKKHGGKNHWKDWTVTEGMEGTVVHRWIPCHFDSAKRSHIDKTILLVHIEDKYVPISENAVVDLGAEV